MATANQKVGSVYEVGVEGVGYMLADNPSRPVRRQTGVLDTQSPGSEEPLSERIGRYDFIGQSDWTGGAGQEMLDRPTSDVTRYFYSEHLFPFEPPGQLTCLRSPTKLVTSTGALLLGQNEWAIVTTDGLFVHEGGTSTDLVFLDEPTGTPATFDTGLTTPPGIASLTTDGEYWYATDGDTIRRNNTNADPMADWSTQNTDIIEWCVDRLIGVSSAAPFTLREFAPDGTASTVTTLPAGSTGSGLCGGDGFVWFGVYQIGSTVGRAYIGYWQVDSDPINLGVAFTLPPGEIPTHLTFYLGNVFIVTHSFNIDGDLAAKIYRAVPSDGILTPQVVIDDIALPDGVALGHLAGVGKYVAFPWPDTTDAGEGIGVIDLETGGYARWTAADVAGRPWSAVAWNSTFGFVLVDDTNGGFYWPESDNAYHVGYFETSTSDLATPALKHLDAIEVATLPLPASTSVAVAYSVDGGATYTTAATFNTAGDTQHSVELSTEVVAASFRFKATLTPNGSTAAPTVTALLAKTHATGITDEIIELPVNCDDHITDVKGHPIAEDSGHDKGAARYRSLQALTGTKVLFQDTDWKTTGTETLVEVVGVESSSVLVFNPKTNRSDIAQHVAVVTLRRPFS